MINFHLVLVRRGIPWKPAYYLFIRYYTSTQM